MIEGLLIEKHFKKVDAGYRNLILICMDRKINLYDFVDKIYTDIRNSKVEGKLTNSPKCIRSLIFLSIIAELIGTTFEDICELSAAEKARIITNILKRVEGLKASKIDFLNNESDKAASFISTFSIPNDYGNSDYELLFKRTFNGDKYLYSLEVCSPVNKNIYKIEDFMVNPVLVWKEHEGELRDFIEGAIKSMDSCSDDLEVISEDDLLVEITEDTPELPKYNNKNIKEEFITTWGYSQRLLDVFDKFDGVREGDIVYRRMVLEFAEYSVTLGMNVGVHLVIERYIGNYQCGGSLTLSQLRDHSDWSLANYLKTVLDDEIISRYYEKDSFYRFEKPYGIRNNIRKKREPFGKECVWSTDKNMYIDVRSFDCKVNYVIAGAYISAKYSKYNPDTRKHL